MLSVRPARLAVVALLLMSLIWGYNWVVMKQVIRYVDPFDFSAIRTLLAAVALFTVVIIARRPLRPVALRQLLLLGLLQTAAFTALIQWALVSGGAGKTAILVYTMPFWLMPLAWWLLGERVRGVQWVATVVAAVGLVLILDPWSMAGSVMGNVLAVGGGLTWALATVVAKRMRRDHDFDLLSMTAWQMLFGAIALCVVALLVPSRPIDPTPYFFGALIYNAVFATALAWLLWLYVLQNLPAGVAGLSALGIPLIGALAGWIELGERPSTGEFAGMALIVVALALTSLWPLLQARRKA
ncbi:MAG: EamA family transporter [Betaproteobacteria bacterium HGW-Betaproteobacteria-13]|jgi:drug/metabolite transporter (DMT)-like permease|uniref:EamA family transporter n=1 Tax=Parazoarcus communis TaxID=41977 RepID=A0A2U8HAE6_9RHOO|nr:EamA family transporter [Parazoarcus communis]AWI82066.1 EamA family transporter [Parazoarcus communis]PKO55853.1 MAG: EamA family transporter [Betaproteobacteria bacterium HGW-Betaproteobacteria-21]PKO79121.1 MAG: EamA family transporter [Betaproteobacteria bacterium HGW-Betaproteobacteria-13]